MSDDKLWLQKSEKNAATDADMSYLKLISTEMPSVLHLALMSKTSDSLKTLLDNTNINLLETDAITGDTCIHMAVRYSNDLSLLESLLIRLRSLLPEREKLQQYLNKKNND